MVLLFSCLTSHLTSGPAIWLVPWEMEADQLASLPGPLAGYPPSGAHAAELAGIAILAGILALAVTIRGARARGGLAAAGIVAVAAICVAGVLQARPIPTADLNHLVAEVADPASVQHCTTDGQVRLCLYPAFSSLLPSLEAPAGGVLAHLPAQPAEPLTIRQVTSVSLPDSTLTHGHSNQQVSQWDAAAQQEPGNVSAAPASSVYVTAWPPAGQQAGPGFSLALATADWALGLPGASGTSGGPGGLQGCVPVGQARDAVAIWLAIIATHSSASALQGGLEGIQGAYVGSTFVRTWSYPGGGYVVPPNGPQDTAAGYLLASEMASEPQQKVSDVLAGAWSRWLNWRTTDAQLAAALGIPIPSLSTPAAAIPPAQGTPHASVCTS
jgi:hypothetical protein